jgi:Trk K+ transport system NAD-binding subunit
MSARSGATAIGDTLGLDAVEDRVELGLADPEGIVVVLEIAALVEIEGQRLVDLDRREMGMRAVVFEPEDPREKPGRGDLVAGRDNRVIEADCHDHSPAA